MPDALQHIMSELTPWLQEYGYVLLFIAIAVEGFGIPAPGQSLLIVASLLAATGQMSLSAVLMVAACGALCGNSFGYYIGWRFGGGVTEQRLDKTTIRRQDPQRYRSIWYSSINPESFYRRLKTIHVYRLRTGKNAAETVCSR